MNAFHEEDEEKTTIRADLTENVRDINRKNGWT